MFTLNCKGRLLVIDKPMVMGIINITPDSFYDGSRQTDESILSMTTKMVNDGADIIDIGGQSTRPGSERISIKEELKRVLPAIEIILKGFPDTIISVDTYQSAVAEESVNAGAVIINDISAGNMDSDMIFSCKTWSSIHLYAYERHSGEYAGQSFIRKYYKGCT